MDGIPMSNDAGMTYDSGTTVGNNISLNRGVDMRTMPTDEIASVQRFSRAFRRSNTAI